MLKYSLDPTNMLPNVITNGIPSKTNYALKKKNRVSMGDIECLHFFQCLCVRATHVDIDIY